LRAVHENIRVAIAKRGRTLAIHPTDQQLKALSEGELANPVVMLNLLRFNSDGGQRSYDRYSGGVQSSLQEVGAQVLWYGRADSVVIGDDNADAWDAVALVRYPSRKAFLEMIENSDYQEVGKNRTSALTDSRLIACTELFPGA
jgi:uncharacterized protein (DUF1330 family)